MKKLNDQKAENRVNNLCAKFKVRYPHLYGTSGSRYIRQIIRNLYADSGFGEPHVAPETIISKHSGQVYHIKEAEKTHQPLAKAS